ncbi:cellular nucleic acid-binding protein-like [Acyrthosiphon pisum]|uniref:CCHC-type domain-containing protein n=1 Tax=Acyrthosiphon pisum TaxID=7029 RepID=A0A8R2D5C5_ACYPI|nr:cellular nucleic acid-binding protein-like [Acyrthosiphon pisum]|eukprot:XP_016662187.1 PREDICTED: cellular nucleic acid-binding protein-like [Acyrthosiphon pisum]
MGKTEVRYEAMASMVTIKDLEPETTEEEVLEAVAKATGSTSSAKVLRITFTHDGCKTAAKAAKTRCYRCHDYGHIRATCKGKDRTKLCMTCGKEDHKAKDCSSPPRCVICEEKCHEAKNYTGSARCRCGTSTR